MSSDLQRSFRTEIENRSHFYQLDSADRAMVAGHYDAIKGKLLAVMEGRVELIRAIPHYRDTLTKFGARIAAAQAHHFANLARCRFDDDYVESLFRSVEVEAESGFGVGAHLAVGPAVADLYWDVLAARHRFSGAALGRAARAVTTLLYFDLANASALHNRNLASRFQERADRLQASSSRFLQSIAAIRATLTGTSKALVEASSQAVEAATKAGTQADLTTASWSQATHAISSISRSTDEISASISVIGDQTVRSQEAARDAVETARASEQAIAGLRDLTSTIGSVVSLIDEIASRTNLLALNATIEAARAGEAGRGFAVVAQEVKLLSGQTSRATQDITDHITRIGEATRACYAGIERVAGVIHGMETMAATIATSVAQQGAATSEIAQRAHEAVSMTDAVVKSSHMVRDIIGGMASTAAELKSFSHMLAAHSDQLDGEANKFIAAAKV